MMDYHKMSSANLCDYRKSGFTLSLIVVVLYGLLIVKGRNMYLLPLIAVIIAIASQLKAKLLCRGIDIFIKSGHIMSRVTNPLVLGLIYITTIMPVALVLKVIGKDILGLKSDAALNSYWEKNCDARNWETSFKQQF